MVMCVNKGMSLNIDDMVKLDFLWPDNADFISVNAINNNSIVCKLKYRKFSMLFTGDIEKIAENKIYNVYKKETNKLSATVLKVPHHGSKTSSTESFINMVRPKYAVIGVGQNNKFGHPNEDVINRLEKLRNHYL